MLATCQLNKRKLLEKRDTEGQSNSSTSGQQYKILLEFLRERKGNVWCMQSCHADFTPSLALKAKAPCLKLININYILRQREKM